MALFPGDDWYRPVPKRPGAAKSAGRQGSHGRAAPGRPIRPSDYSVIQNTGKYGTAFGKAVWIH